VGSERGLKGNPQGRPTKGKVVGERRNWDRDVGTSSDRAEGWTVI